ncbi:MAG: transposase, partial [Mesorhizobium sp.]
AARLGLSQATAYRLIKLFRAGGTILSLIDRKRGRPKGHRVLDDKREEIIRATINAYYLKRTRPTVSQLVRDVQTNCISAGLKPPHRRTIVARLKEIDLQKRAKRRGEQKIVKATTPVPGTFVAGLPDMVHVDNGADFRSRAFKRGCQDAGIAIEWRPPGEPRFGGHIERLIGAQMGRLHLLPGTTFSNEQDLG